jgi:hypothetical protein
MMFSDLSIVVSLDPIHRVVIKNVKHIVFRLEFDAIPLSY